MSTWPFVDSGIIVTECCQNTETIEHSVIRRSFVASVENREVTKRAQETREATALESCKISGCLARFWKRDLFATDVTHMCTVCRPSV